jgi:ABC-type nitrate/sulfonate/bicarbonate transport system substrate-binding protein
MRLINRSLGRLAAARTGALKRFGAVFLATFALAPGQATAVDKPFIYGLPGNPPVFLAVLPYVAADVGFFKKYGVDVALQPFETGIAATRAAASGEIDFVASTTSVAINISANTGVPLVGIYGMENSDWLVGSSDPAVKTCGDLPGKSVAVDSLGGARSLALQQMILPPPCNLKMEDLKQVSVGSGMSAAMISSGLKVGVLHLDDLAVIEDKLGRRLTTIITLRRVRPLSHYDLFAARQDKLQQSRDRYVRVLAALIEAENYMRSSKNWDRVAQIATVTGRSETEARESLKKYLEIEFWPNGHDGLDQRKIEAEIATQLKVGGIKNPSSAPTYQSLVDRSLFRDAVALRKSK